MAQTSRSDPATGGAVPTQSQDGERRHRTEIHASEVVFLDSRNGQRGSAEPESAETEAEDVASAREPVASPF